MAWKHSSFRMNRWYGRFRGGTLLQIVEKYDAQEGHKLGALNLVSLVVTSAYGCSTISVLGARQSLRWAQGEDPELFYILNTILRSVDRLHLHGDFDTLEIDRIFLDSPEGHFWVSTTGGVARGRFGSTYQPRQSMETHHLY